MERLSVRQRTCTRDGGAPCSLQVRGQGQHGFAADTRVVWQLPQLGIRTVMLTGDDRGAAQAVAKELGIDDVRAELLPGDKAASGRAGRCAPAQAHIEEPDDKLKVLHAMKATLEHLVHCGHGDDRPDSPR